jgi:hypothetical protein
MNQVGLGWAIGASLLIAVGCGGTDKPSKETAGAAGEGSNGAGAGPTGSAGSETNPGSAGAANNGGAAGRSDSSGSAGSAGNAGAAQSPSYSGAVQVGWTDNGTQFYTSTSAVFSAPNQSTGRTCTSEVIASCRVNTCVSATQSTTMPQAGTITVSNGDMFNATLIPNGDGGYTAHSEQHVLLPGEDLITIQASGGDVPAFSTVIIQPLTLLITSPVANSSGELAWSRAADLPLKFERGVPTVQLLVQGGASPGVTIDCLFPSEAGEAVIPAAVLKRLPLTAILSIFTYKIQSLTAGKYGIDIKAFSSAMDPEKLHGIRVNVQ